MCCIDARQEDSLHAEKSLFVKVVFSVMNVLDRPVPRADHIPRHGNAALCDVTTPPTAEKNVEQNADTPSSKTVETKTTYKNNWRAIIGTYRFVSCLLVYMSGHLFADASSVFAQGRSFTCYSQLSQVCAANCFMFCTHQKQDAGNVRFFQCSV